jgi:hypothetical protein
MKVVANNGFKGVRQNGRTPGSPNKSTKEVRERFKALLDNNIETIEKDLLLLEPKDRINAILQLAKYVVPQLRSIEVNEMNIKDIEPIIIQINETNSD